MRPDQIVTIQDAFKKCSTIRKEGLVLGEKSYNCIRADRNSIYAKTVIFMRILLVLQFFKYKYNKIVYWRRAVIKRATMTQKVEFFS